MIKFVMTCDGAGCDYEITAPAEFVLEDESKVAGWARIETNDVETNDEKILNVCPWHFRHGITSPIPTLALQRTNIATPS